MINDKILAEVKNLVPDAKTASTYLDLIKTQVMGTSKDGKSRSTEDTLLFLYVAKKTGLDPLIKQIYPIYRWDSRLSREKMTIQTGIDGLRLIAQRTGEYGGQDEPKSEYDKDGKLKSVLVTVIKIPKNLNQQIRVPARAIMSEYVQTDREGKPMGLWGKMPETMLEKCAESKALRKAFPAETTG
ncbi:MAG: phage recombination protein Bet, partial [Candidatus Moraniibacteriota bacterium]